MDIINIVNTVRDNSSQSYQDRVPELTRENLADVRYAMTGDGGIPTVNEFISTLLNGFAKEYLIKKMFTNPLKSLKKGTKPLGDTNIEIYNNFIKGEKYDPTGAELLKRNLPDTKTLFHRMNYEMQYPITVSRSAIAKAFTSFANLEAFISNILQVLYNSAELDEFMNFKQIFADAIEKNAVKIIEIADPCKNKTNAEAFIKSVKTTSRLMTFPNSDFNGYLTAQNTDTIPITTLSRKQEQILILDAATDTNVSVDVLANTFNMSVADFNDTRKIVIDVFPVKNMRAALVDEDFFQFFDDLYEITTFYNGKGLYQNYYLNVWQTIAYSILVNAVVFMVPEDTTTNE